MTNWYCTNLNHVLSWEVVIDSDSKWKTGNEHVTLTYMSSIHLPFCVRTDSHSIPFLIGCFLDLAFLFRTFSSRTAKSTTVVDKTWAKLGHKSSLDWIICNHLVGIWIYLVCAGGIRRRTCWYVPDIPLPLPHNWKKFRLGFLSPTNVLIPDDASKSASIFKIPSIWAKGYFSW